MGVDACAHCGASQGHFPQLLLGELQAAQAALHLPLVATEHLAQPDGRGILKVSAGRLDDRPELIRLVAQGRLQALQRGNQSVLYFHESGEVDAGGYHVVGGLAHVHMVVGVDALAGLSQNLCGPVADDFVGVGVGGGA